MSESLLVVETFITTTLCCIEFAEACCIKNLENPFFFYEYVIIITKADKRYRQPYLHQLQKAGTTLF